MHKAQIRKQINKQKQLLTRAEISACAQRFWAKLSENKTFIASNHVAFYYPFNNELDVIPALQHAIKAGKKCYLPHIAANSDTLEFMYFDNDTALEYGAYNIQSPKLSEASLFIDPHELDLVIMPAVAIDRSHHRVGMGKGYYDKTFSFKTNKPRLIAACYEFQVIEAITPDPWDVKCDDYIVV